MKNIAFAFPMHIRTITVVTVLALLSWTLGLPMWIHNANAATVLRFSDTLSDSDLGVDAIHTIQFELVNVITENQTMRLTFDPLTQAFDFTGLVNGDTTISAVSGGPINQVAAVGNCPAPGGGGIYVSNTNTTSDYVELTVCGTQTIPSGTVVEVVVGDANRINNPAGAGSYVIRLGGTMADTGDTRVAIIDDVTVTASVDTIFTFSINGVDADVTVNGDVIPTSGTSTATNIPFGTIAPNTPKLMAQELRVDTNALNGFSVTVFADQTLTAGNTATIDPFINGSEIASSTLWQGPSNIFGSPNTYGHWGLSSDDNVVSSTTAPGMWGIGAPAYVGNFINNPVEVFYHNAAVQYDQGGMGVGSTTVAYKVEIGFMQEAAQDYTATLTYIATPVF